MPELIPVRGIITAPQTEPLSGTGQVSYGAEVGSTGATERWAYAPTVNSPAGGIYDVTTGGVWTRATDLDASAEFNGMPWFQVEEGNNLIGGSTWWYSGIKNPTLGTTNITFTKRTDGQAPDAGTGLEFFNNEIRLVERPGVSGTWANPSRIGITDRGTVDDIEAAEAAEADTFLEGLRLVYNSASSLKMRAGLASLPDGTSAGLAVDSDKALTLTANTWYQTYIFNSDGVGDWEYVTTAADAPYLAEARAKTADTTRRFTGSIRAGASANTMRIFHRSSSGWTWWQMDTTTFPRVLSGGVVGNTWTAVNCSAVVPPTAREVFMVVRVPGGQAVEIGSDGAIAIITIGSGDVVGFNFVLNASQQFYYRHPGGAPGTGTNIDVLGYYEPLA